MAMFEFLQKSSHIIFTFGPFVSIIILLGYWVIGFKWFKSDNHGDNE